LAGNSTAQINISHRLSYQTLHNKLRRARLAANTIHQMKEAKQNGKLLEKAVRLIQETLLENNPKLKGGQFTIELNKRPTVGGAHHEADVCVVTQPGTSYESITLGLQ
jgi:hypothetical protein